MQQTFNFEIKKENLRYELSTTDSTKSNGLLADRKDKAVIFAKKTEIILRSENLKTIANTIGDDYNIFVDAINDEKKRYSINCSRNDFDKLKLVLLENGTTLKSSVIHDSFVAIEANSQTLKKNTNR